VGLIQRSIESVGIATISISLAKDITEKLRLPRALFFGFPLGHPMGYPQQASSHRRVLRQLLRYLKEIDSPGTIIAMNVSGKNDGEKR
jgi:D-proline reductase (dithiol) PrdB